MSRDTPRSLVIGYGNPLRRDDGVGWRVARELAEDARARDLDVRAMHQLTPEIAYDLYLATVAVLVDAAIGVPPGSIEVTQLSGRLPERACPVASHVSSPDALACLARQVYGRAAPTTLVGVGAACVDEGYGLTPVVERAIPTVLSTIIQLVSAGGESHA